MTKIFPFEAIRPGQDMLIKKTEEALSSGKNLLAHAPTGIGKTAAILAPALEYALENKKRVLFVTPRHSQHKIAVETLKKISDRHGIKFNAADIIGRQWLCGFGHADKMYGTDFASWCSHQVKNNICALRKKTYSKEGVFSRAAEDALKDIEGKIMHVEDAKDLCRDLCPYEILMRHAKRSEVIIADYFHAFHPKIASAFFSKTGITPSDCILVVDEAHNAAVHIRSMCSAALTSHGLALAKNELESAGFSELAKDVAALASALEETYLSKTSRGRAESFSEKEDIVSAVEKITDYATFIEDIDATSDEILAAKKKSYARALSVFLAAWAGTDNGFARIVSPKKGAFGTEFSYSYHCLDPSAVASGIINGMHSTILMSGTLFPAEMHKTLLGIENAENIALDSPFPKENRLDLVVPNLTSKYSERTKETFRNYANCIKDIAECVPGNIGVYFPSYDFRDEVAGFLEGVISKPLVLEEAGATKKEKRRTFEKFVSNAKAGSLLLAVVGAGFSEGVDFPGEYMNAVVIAGMPLERPDLLTKAVISHYDKKFGRGWDYGYIYPAVNRAVQASGRCIRSETDRGIIFFLDLRFLLPNYRRAMPKDVRPRPAMDIRQECARFFSPKKI